MTTKVDSGSNPIETLDRLLKFVSFCAAIAATVGFWALWTQFSAIGAPLSLLSLQDAAKAGLLPTVVLAAGGLLAYAGYRYREDKSALTWLSYALLAVAFGLGIILILPGVIVGMAWLIHFPVDLLAYPAFDGWTPVAGMVTSFVIAFFGTIGTYVQEKWTSRVSARLADTAAVLAPPAMPELATGDASGDAAVKGATLPNSDLHGDRSAGPLESAFTAVTVVIGLFLYAAFSMAALRWFGHVLDWAIPFVHDLSNGDIWRSALVFAIFVSTIGGIGYLIIEARNAHRVAIWSSITAALMVVGFTIFYARVAFPLIPSALGGGRAETLTLWLDPDELPEPFAPGAPGSCTTASKLVLCDGVTVLRLGEYLIFPGIGADGEAIVVKADAIKALKQSSPEPSGI